MSGGVKHVLQALANLEILRSYQSHLPVEFWHSFELEEPHCEALRASGATCRSLPGVYGREYSTIVPAVMSSSFQHVLWMDTDVTPLLPPEVLFDTDAYKETGALFWPDHWAKDCFPFGESSWPNHVAYRLLQLKYNESDRHFSHEHETGFFLIDKVKHWRVIALAHYLSSRHFFTKVLVGCKDAFRLAFLKFNVSIWFGTVRPGLVGTFITSDLFMPGAMLQFWPSGIILKHGLYITPKTAGRHSPLFIHQKKKLGIVWKDVVNFENPIGTCTRFNLETFDVQKSDTVSVWHLQATEPYLAQKIYALEAMWEKSYVSNLATLTEHPDLSSQSKRMLIYPNDPSVSKNWDKDQGCVCDMSNNFWLHFLTFLSPTSRGLDLKKDPWPCQLLMFNFDPRSCPVGYAALAVACYDLMETIEQVKLQGLVAQMISGLEECLPHSFWPIRLDALRRFASGTEITISEMIFNMTFEVPEVLRQCLPLKWPECWHPKNAITSFGFMNTNLGVKNACVYSCVEASTATCFDELYTKERCCNEP